MTRITMKELETQYNKHGWKLKVKKSTDKIYQIFLRSKWRHHQCQKPFYLRLEEKELDRLINMIKRLRGKKLREEKR